MNEYLDWYDVAEWMNKTVRGKFVEREVAQGAYEMMCEYQRSKSLKRPTRPIMELLAELVKHDSLKTYEWFNLINEGIFQ